jgi:hypothetical protein
MILGDCRVHEGLRSPALCNGSVTIAPSGLRPEISGLGSPHQVK